LSKFLSKLKKKSSNPYLFIANEENNIYSNKQTTSTGCLILNALISGNLNNGIEDGKRYLFAGEEGVGKSFLCMSALKNYLEVHKNAIAICLESEGSSILKMCETFEIDLSRILIVPIKTVEECRTEGLHFLSNLKLENEGKEEKDKQKMIFLIDSIGNLSTKKELEDIESGSDTRDMTRTQLLKGFGRATSLELSLQGVPMLMITHVYDSMDRYSPSVVSGGSGIKYISDFIAVLTKGKEKEGTTQTGVIVRVTVRKSRYTTEGISAKILISFKHGLYIYSDLVTKAYEDFGIFKKEGNSFILPDGQKVLMKKVREKFKEYANDTNLSAINEAIQKHFKFGQVGEELTEIVDEEILNDEEE